MGRKKSADLNGPKAGVSWDLKGPSWGRPAEVCGLQGGSHGTAGELYAAEKARCGLELQGNQGNKQVSSVGAAEQEYLAGGLLPGKNGQQFARQGKE